MKSPNLFIFSLPRSGSTLLVSLLNSNKNIRILNDTFIYRTFIKRINESDLNAFKRRVIKFISRKYPPVIEILSRLRNNNKTAPVYSHPFYKKLPDSDQNISISQRKKFLKELIWFYDNTIKLLKTEWLIEYKNNLKFYNMNKMDKNITVKDFLNSIFDLIFDDEGNSFDIIGEKTPFNLHINKWLNRLYPDSKKIILIRNPVTNIGSMVNHGQEFNLALQHYLNSYRLNFKNLYYKKNNIFVRYEDLVYNTEKTIESIYNYLDIKKHSISMNLNSNIRNDYVGNKIDPERDRQKFALLSKKEKENIYSSCKEIIETYYPDWNKFYPEYKIKK